MASSSNNPWKKPSAPPQTQAHPVTSSLRDIMNEQTKEEILKEPQLSSRHANWSGRHDFSSGMNHQNQSNSPKFTFESTPATSTKHMDPVAKVVNVRARNLRENGYKDLVEWIKDPNHVYIGRDMTHYVPGAVGSKWHNPFKDKQMGRDECVRRFKEHIKTNKQIQSNGLTLLDSLHELKGKTLGCWCHPERCHGHALVELIEEYVHD